MSSRAVTARSRRALSTVSVTPSRFALFGSFCPVYPFTSLTSSSSTLLFPRGENFYRDAKKAKVVKLLSKNGIASKAIRNRDGKIVQAAEFQSSEATPGRVQPDRRWFGEFIMSFESVKGLVKGGRWIGLFQHRRFPLLFNLH